MWIEKRSAKSFKFVEQYKDPLTNKFHRVSVTFSRNTTHTRKEANRVLTKKIHSRLRHYGIVSIKSNITLGELTIEWLQQLKRKVKFNTFQNNKSRTKGIISFFGSDALIQKISPSLLSNYIDFLIQVKNYHNSTIRKFKGTLNSLFKYAIKHQYLAQNPLNYVDIGYQSPEYKERPEEKFLDDYELEKVLNYMYKRSPHYGHFCEFLYLTGLRYGEAAALIPANIQKDSSGKPFAIISGTIVNGKRQSSPKTANSWRNVSLTERALRICEEESNYRSKKVDFIFSSERGNYLGNTVLNLWLRQAKKDLNIHKQLTLHTFRHTHISKLAELGVPLYLIQARVGHKNAETTNNIYLHVTRKAEHLLDQKLKYL